MAPLQRRRVALVASALVGTSLTLSACGGPTNDGAATQSESGDANTINVVVLGDATTDASLMAVFDAYQEDNPGKLVNPVSIPLTSWPDFLSVLQTRLLGGADYDAVYLPTEGQLTLSSRGVLRSLDDLIEADKEFMDDYYADLYPAMLDEFNAKETVDGKTYFAPHLVNTMGIWYNKSVFDQAGLDYPGGEWTWDDFLADAEAISALGDDVYGFNLAPDLFKGMDPWLSTNGAAVLNPEWTESVVNSDAAVESVTFARTLVEKGLVPTPGGTYDEYAALANGKLGMMGAGMWAVASFSGLGGTDNLGVAPWPMNTQQGSPMGLGAYGILDSSTKVDDTWNFIKWMISPKGQSMMLTLGAQPVRMSTQQSEEYLSELPDGGQYLDEALSYAHLIVGVEQGGEIGTEVIDSWSQMLLGSTSERDGLDALNAKIDAALAN